MNCRRVSISSLASFTIVFGYCVLLQPCSAFDGIFEIEGKGYVIEDGADLSNLVFRNVRMRLYGVAHRAREMGGTNFDTFTKSAVFPEFRYIGHNIGYSGVEPLVLRNVRFDNSDLRNAVFGAVHFTNCSFRGANMSGVQDIYTVSSTRVNRAEYDSPEIMAFWAEYHDCDFTDATIDGAHLVRISGENFRSTRTYKKSRETKELIFEDGSPLWLRDCSLDGTSFKDYRIQNIVLWDTSLKDCDFSGACLEHVVLGSSNNNWDEMRKHLLSTKNYYIGVFDKVSVGANFADVDFSSMCFTYCVLYGNFANTDFTNSVITGSSFSGQNLTVDQIKSTWNYKSGRMAGINLPKEIQQALNAEQVE